MKDDNIRAALLMMAGTGAYTVNDVFVKLLGDQLPMFQIIVLRGVFVTLFFGALVWRARAGFAGLERRDRWLVLARSTSEALAAWFFLTALLNMPIANVTAILQVLPLSVALAAFLFLREPLGWRRLSAIMVGFGGVMLIVRPGAEGFNIFAVYAIIAVLLITMRDLTTRMMSRSVPSVLVAFSASVGVTGFGVLGSMTEAWVMPSGAGLLWLAGAVLTLIGGYLMTIMAMRVGELTFAAPFRYAALLVALILGWLVFAEWPDSLTLTGAAIVVATGVYTLYRERVLRQRMRRKLPGQTP